MLDIFTSIISINPVSLSRCYWLVPLTDEKQRQREGNLIINGKSFKRHNTHS